MVPAVPSPITPEVVAWAVGEDGRSRALLAEKLRVDADTLDGWVRGYVTPSKGEVSRLAEVLHRPRALFFMPRAPQAATLPASFRHPPGMEQSVGAEARRRVRQARRVQTAIAWVRADEPEVELPEASVDEPPELAGVRVRDWLGVTDAMQAGWSGDLEGLRTWRAALEDAGLLVFALPIGRDDVRGFSAWDARAPLIVVNSSAVSPAARTYTLMHELGHLVLRQDAACIELDSPGGETGADVERWCERLAATVLMPEQTTRQWFRALRVEEADLDVVKKAMTRFRVSARAAALRLIALGYATRALYSEVVRVFVPKPPSANKKMASDPRAVLRRREYGDQVLRAVLNELPPRDALSILRLQVDDARRIASEVPGVRDVV